LARRVALTNWIVGVITIFRQQHYTFRFQPRKTPIDHLFEQIKMTGSLFLAHFQGDDLILTLLPKNMKAPNTVFAAAP
jgi:hypothetical protein